MGTSSSKMSRLGYFPDDFKHSFEGKVIIIGAGAAGMTAGYVLSELGIEFEILEASSTYGGRMKKVDDFADFPIDLGAEWVHPMVGGGREIPFLKDILASRDADFETFAYRPKNEAIWDSKNDKLHKPTLTLMTMKIAEKFVNDHKFKNSTWFDVFDQRVYPKVKDHIRYNQVVEEIDYCGEKVLVGIKGSDAKIHADKVLMTVPIQILQQKRIAFLPEMPAEKVTAIDNEVVPEGMKVFMEFTEKFYHDMIGFDGLSNLAHTHGSGVYDAAYGKKTDKNVLGFFLVRREAERYLARVFDYKPEDCDDIRSGRRRYDEFTAEHREKLVKLLIEDLDKLYDGKASKCFVKSVVQNWSCEPHIQGSYSSWQRKGYKDRVSPLSNKVYFAGEAFNLKRNMIAVHATAESSYLSLQAMLKPYESK